MSEPEKIVNSEEGAEVARLVQDIEASTGKKVNHVTVQQVRQVTPESSITRYVSIGFDAEPAKAGD